MPTNKAIRAQRENLRVEMLPVSTLKPNRRNARVQGSPVG
jgi:hypothetical protein